MRRFVARCAAEGLALDFSSRALEKPVNADVSLLLALGAGRRASVKFHARPLLEVVAFERTHGTCEAVPPGYFDAAAAPVLSRGADALARSEARCTQLEAALAAQKATIASLRRQCT